MRLNKSINAKYTGYVLQSYARSTLLPEQVKELYTRLERIPPKINAFIDRDTIAEAYKYTDWYYFIIDTNNDVYVLDY